MSTPPAISRLAIIGVGLIGGSFSLALQRQLEIGHIVGVGRGAENLKTAQQRGIIHSWTHDPCEAVKGADVVMLATSVASTGALLQRIAPALSPETIVTDVGSTKQSVMAEAQRYLPDVSRFVPAHPLAGTEHAGAAAAFAELYDGRWCLLTPDATTDAQAVNHVEAWWQAAGAKVLRMAAAEHDDLLAAVSHLPHMAAYAVVNSVAALERDQHDPFQFAAGGFRDFTRIASSSPEMWRDIALCNRQALLHKLDALQDELRAIRQALADGDGETLLAHFTAARDAREAWLNNYGLKQDQ